MEKQLFTWGSWDLCDNLFITFMNCVFIKDVGKYRAGDKVYCIDMDFEEGLMYVYESADELDIPNAAYKLELQVNEA
jgi:hypothetical protein